MLVAAGVAVDAFTDGDPRNQILIALPMTFAQFALVSALMRGAGLHRAWAQPGRVASYVGLGIVTGLAIFAGLMLLILPGLYLYARWIVTTPLVVGEGARMGEAMARSWRRTARAGVPIAAALALVNLPFVASMVVMLYLYPAYGPAPLGVALLSNMLFFASSIASWYLAVAAHALLGGSGEDRSEHA